ncbi:MAG: efflux transporter periplasmic adaptor subunit, partial [Dokdonella sp.]
MNVRPFAVAIMFLTLTACGETSAPHADADGHAAHGDEAPEQTIGVHGGRLLAQDGYSVEVSIEENGVPPRFRAWLQRGGNALIPAAGQLVVVLTRLGGAQDTHTFVAEGDALIGSDIVDEPHSFDVEVTATIDGKHLQWRYPSYEGRTRIASAIASQSGIRSAPVAAG